MPLFKKKKSSMANDGKYPRQGQTPAMDPNASMAQPAYFYPTQQGYQPPQPPPYSEAPPAYGQQAYVQHPLAQQPYPQPPYGQQQYPPQPYGPPQGYPYGGYMQQQQTVIVAGGFEAGARFGPDGAAGARIPPPPPGCAPNAAQIAQAQGHVVACTQQPSSFLEGGGSGGMVIW